MDPLTLLSVAQTLRGGSRKRGVVGMIGIKNLLTLVGLAVVGFGVAGWYLGWYNIATQTDATGHTHVDVQVDSSKVVQDLQNGGATLQNAVNQQANRRRPDAPAGNPSTAAAPQSGVIPAPPSASAPVGPPPVYSGSQQYAQPAAPPVPPRPGLQQPVGTWSFPH